MKPQNFEHEKLVAEALTVLSELSKRGFCRVWKQPTGAAFRDGVMIRYGLVGCADITGIWQNGKRLEIEIKTGRAKQSKEQIQFEHMIRNMGGYYLVARNIPDMLANLKSMTE